MEFHNNFFLLVSIPAFVALIIGFHLSSNGRLRFSSIQQIRKSGPFSGIRNSKIAPLIRFLVVSFLVFAFAGPRFGVSGTEKFPYGADVMIVVDTSTSIAPRRRQSLSSRPR